MSPAEAIAASSVSGGSVSPVPTAYRCAASSWTDFSDRSEPAPLSGSSGQRRSARVLVAAHGTENGGCKLRLGADRRTTVTVASARRAAPSWSSRGRVGMTSSWVASAFDVINNVGTVMVDNWYGADRGFLQRDAGQFERAEDVTAWCGGAVLLRAAYLGDVGLFDERLFLYYEDLELSLRGANRGWRYRYEPRSIVRHRLGATAVHGSPATERFKERNRLLVLARHFPPGCPRLPRSGTCCRRRRTRGATSRRRCFRVAHRMVRSSPTG